VEKNAPSPLSCFRFDVIIPLTAQRFNIICWYKNAEVSWVVKEAGTEYFKETRHGIGARKRAK